MEPCKCQAACPNHNRLQHKNTLEFGVTTNNYFRKKCNSCNYVCACQWAALLLLSLSRSLSLPVSLMDFCCTKHQHLLSNAQWPLPFGQSAIYICRWATCYIVTSWVLSDFPYWVYLIDLLLEPFCIVSIISNVFFLYYIKACLYPQTISGLTWHFCSVEKALTGPCVPSRFLSFSLSSRR